MKNFSLLRLSAWVGDSKYSVIFLSGTTGRVEGGYYTSPLSVDLDVRLSVHPAPDVLTFRFCSCGCSRGSFRGLLEDCLSSNLSGFHLHGVSVPSHYWAFLVHSIRMYGFAFLGLLRFRHSRVCCYVRYSTNRTPVHSLAVSINPCSTLYSSCK